MKRYKQKRWAHQRRAAIERDGQCVFCGTTEQLTVAHIIPRSKGGTGVLSNLRTLCRPCHDTVTPRWVRGEGYVFDRSKLPA